MMGTIGFGIVKTVRSVGSEKLKISLIWCTVVEVFRTKYYQAIIDTAKEVSIARQYLTYYAEVS